MRDRIILVMALVVGLMSAAAIAQNPAVSPTGDPTPQGTQLDLQKPFHAHSPWRLVVTEGVPVKDYGDNDAPGALTLCLHEGPAGRCLSDAVTPVLRTATPDDAIGWEPHYLLTAKVVYPRGPAAAPFLLLVTASMSSGDGDRVVATQLLTYDSGRDAFRRVYNKSTGRNNNQEIRFIANGPLRGSVITAEPQQHLPFNYWIIVDTLTQAGAYRQVLRYRSATHQNDGNPLAVIDSEMPTIQSRLGLWKPGQPLPSPASVGDGKPCSKPTLKHAELWCQ
jgi:hypothetical protein